MIDTTDPAGIELALTYCQGKSIINSINLEDGEEKFQRTVPIAHEYGAAVVVGCIDEDPVQAQAFTRERSEEHTSELQSRLHLVCRLLLEKKKKNNKIKHLYNNHTKRYGIYTTYMIS